TRFSRDWSSDVCSSDLGSNGLLRELLRNPLLMATLLGLAGNLAGLQLPGPVDTVLARLGSASLALGILCVGASLSWQGGQGHGRDRKSVVEGKGGARGG